MDLWEERCAFMRENAVTRCPPWCVQPEDEHEEGAHLSSPIGFVNVDGQTVELRVRASWYDPNDNMIFMQTSLDENDDLALNFDDMQNLAGIGEELMAMVHQFWSSNDSPSKPGYPGAEDDDE